MLRDARGIAVLILSFLLSLSILCLSGCGGTATCGGEQVVSLNGAWRFIPDKNNEGVNAKWFEQKYDRSKWSGLRQGLRPDEQEVEVPHTWQVMEGLEGYYGNAWYARSIKLDCPVQDKILKLEFDSINRDAMVWVNGKLIGEHKGSGYTPFGFVIPQADVGNGTMEIVVRVANGFSRKALPYDRSYDWTTDSGIIRAVRLKILPQTHIERLLVNAEPTTDFTQAKVSVRVNAYAAENKTDGLSLYATILDPSNNIVGSISAPLKKDNDGNLTTELSCVVEKPMLWHFDKPHLYRFVCRLMNNGVVIHEKEASFGIRKVEVKDGFYVLNGERMRLMGVEWMPGSDPRYGLAEKPEYVREVLEDMKNLNCVLTRFHWQQDDTVAEETGID